MHPAYYAPVVQRIGYHATNVGTVVRFHPGVPIYGVISVVACTLLCESGSTGSIPV